MGPLGDGRHPLAHAEALLVALTDAYVLAELDGQVLAANTAARQLLVGTDSISPPPVHRWTTDPDLASELLVRWRSSSAPKPATFTLASGREVRGDGARLSGLDWLLIRLREREQSAAAYVNVTSQHRERQLRALSQRLDETIAQLHDANRSLLYANEELQQYAGAVAHDVRTPLFTLRGFAQMLLDGEHVDERGTMLVELILASADRLHQTTDSMLAIARLDAQPVRADPTPLRDALRAALDVQRRELALADATVIDDALAGLGAAVPAEALRQVLQNLVANSLRFRDPERPLRIVLEARELGELVEVAVTDNGVGVDEHERDHLFDLFQRGTRRSTTPGHGIGLATCRKLVTRWGGTIRCEAVSGPGARFVFTAPSHPPEDRRPPPV